MTTYPRRIPGGRLVVRCTACAHRTADDRCEVRGVMLHPADLLPERICERFDATKEDDMGGIPQPEVMMSRQEWLERCRPGFYEGKSPLALSQEIRAEHGLPRGKGPLYGVVRAKRDWEKQHDLSFRQAALSDLAHVEAPDPPGASADPPAGYDGESWVEDMRLADHDLAGLHKFLDERFPGKAVIFRPAPRAEDCIIDLIRERDSLRAENASLRADIDQLRERDLPRVVAERDEARETARSTREEYTIYLTEMTRQRDLFVRERDEARAALEEEMKGRALLARQTDLAREAEIALEERTRERDALQGQIDSIQSYIEQETAGGKVRDVASDAIDLIRGRNAVYRLCQELKSENGRLREALFPRGLCPKCGVGVTEDELTQAKCFSCDVQPEPSASTEMNHRLDAATYLDAPKPTLPPPNGRVLPRIQAEIRALTLDDLTGLEMQEVEILRAVAALPMGGAA